MKKYGQKCLKFNKNFNSEFKMLKKIKFKKCEENHTKEHHDQPAKTNIKRKPQNQPKEKGCIIYRGTKTRMIADLLIRNNASHKTIVQHL